MTYPTFSIYNGLFPSDGPKIYSVSYSLTSTASRALVIDLYLDNASERIKFVQSVYIDNMESTEDLTLLCQTTNHRIVAKAGTEGWYNILSPTPNKFILSVPVGNAGAVGNITFCNMQMSAIVTQSIPAVIAPSRLVAGRGEMPFQANATAAGTVKRVCRTRHTFGGSASTELELTWVGYYCNGSAGEVNLGGSTTINASVEIVGAPIPLVRVQVGGSNTITVPNGSTGVFSDKLLPSQFGLSEFPANQDFWVKDEREVSVGVLISNSGSASNPVIAGEALMTAATGAPSQVDNSGPLVADANWTVGSNLFMPVAFRGKTKTPEISAVVFGNSIANRVADFSGDGINGAGGMLVRGLAGLSGRNIPYINWGSPSERATLFMGANGFKRRLLLANLGITHVIMELGTNDLGNGRTAAQTLTDLQSIWTFFKSIGVSRVDQCLILNRTSSSTDSYLTIAGQTVFPGFEIGGTLRDPLNTSIIANVGSNGLDGYVDLGPVMADAVATDKWIVDGVTGGLSTADGIHPSRTRHTGAVATVKARTSTWVPTPF